MNQIIARVLNRLIGFDPQKVASEIEAICAQTHLPCAHFARVAADIRAGRLVGCRAITREMQWAQLADAGHARLENWEQLRASGANVPDGGVLPLRPAPPPAPPRPTPHKIDPSLPDGTILVKGMSGTFVVVENVGGNSDV